MPRTSLAPPSAAHWLGADFMGRDVYSRIVYGARISLAVGDRRDALGSTIGVIVGLPPAICAAGSTSSCSASSR